MKRFQSKRCPFCLFVTFHFRQVWLFQTWLLKLKQEDQGDYWKHNASLSSNYVIKSEDHDNLSACCSGQRSLCRTPRPFTVLLRIHAGAVSLWTGVYKHKIFRGKLLQENLKMSWILHVAWIISFRVIIWLNLSCLVLVAAKKKKEKKEKVTVPLWG